MTNVFQVMDTHPGGPTTVQTLAHIKNIVEGWYQDRGYAFGYISHFDGMDTGHIVANVVEGRVSCSQPVVCLVIAAFGSNWAVSDMQKMFLAG